MKMRGICLALLAATGSVTAVTVAVADQPIPASPSIIHLGSAETPAAHALSASMSIISLGEPGVEVINVAAVSKKSRPASMPMVIRGGIVGDAFTASPAATVNLPVADTKAAPGSPVPDQAKAPAGVAPAANPDMASAAPPAPPRGGMGPATMPDTVR